MKKLRSTSAVRMILAAMMVICCCSGTVLADGSVSLKTDEEWDWSRGSYDTFSGEIDLSAFVGQEVTLVMETEMKYDPETEAKSRPVFSSVNGKRLTMARQSDSVSVDVDTDDCIMRFTGSLRLPEKERVNRLEILFRVADEDGKTLTTAVGVIESGDSKAQKSAFYIPVDIRQITFILTAAACIVWILTVVMILRRKNHST